MIGNEEDLTKAVGNAIAVVIAKTVRENKFPERKDALKKLAPILDFRLNKLLPSRCS